MPTELPRRQTQSSHTYRSLILFCLSVFVVTGLIIGGTFAWRWMQQPTSFPISQIEIEGHLAHETPAQLQKIISANISGGFFSLNVSAAKQALLSIPWIADVSFRRVWPGTLTVKVIEQQVIARFGKTGVLNATGDIFYPDAKSLPQNLPDLEGPADQSKVLFDFYQSVNTMAHVLSLSVVALHENDAQSWDLVLSNQVKVIMGRQDAAARFQRFVAIYPRIIAVSNKPMVSVDLRYPNGVAVKYAENKA
ncbi:MAG TPA: FtsQ-type POTRA domain-containing protein [Coxiellaceae bacterium]|nr:MAG: hypothetical protein A3E81_03705 [Gammaproteobacteria bacterium RIFCSPHIGHO2_12_FULL_36_30]HLB56139.1 FtsQ-type POTRA domain-containing protein [Coxiellaceae bacterium]